MLEKLINSPMLSLQHHLQTRYNLFNPRVSRRRHQPHMGLQSPISVNSEFKEIAMNGSNSITTDNYGYNLKNDTGVRRGHSCDSVLQYLYAGINIKGKSPDTYANMFGHFLNLTREQYSIKGTKEKESFQTLLSLLTCQSSNSRYISYHYHLCW